MASLTGQQFQVQVFCSTVQPPLVLQGVRALTELGALSQAMIAYGLGEAVKACLVDAYGYTVLLFGIRRVNECVCYEHRVVA